MCSQRRPARRVGAQRGKVVPLTLSQMIRAVARQWVVVLIGLALTGIAARRSARPNRCTGPRQPCASFTATDSPGIRKPTLVTNSQSLIAFAGLVLADLHLGRGVDVSGLGPNILDIGDDGVWVRLPDGAASGRTRSRRPFSTFRSPDRLPKGYGDAPPRRSTPSTRGRAASWAQGEQPSPSAPCPLHRSSRRQARREVALLATVALGLAGTIGTALGVDALRLTTAGDGGRRPSRHHRLMTVGLTGLLRTGAQGLSVPQGVPPVSSQMLPDQTFPWPDT